MIDFSPIEQLFKFMFILILIFVPLGIWKIIDIIIWLFIHIEII